nr:IS1182 family transposase [Rhodoblastus acidophilus]
MSELFDDLANVDPTKPAAKGRVRLREPSRDQITLQVCDLDALIGDDHPARIIWAYAEKVDLSALEAEVKSREGAPGMPQTSLHLLLALWLYATTRGIGSARALAQMCESDAAFRWLCGGVSVNHRLLSEFRSQRGDLIGRLLAEHVASLSVAGVISLDEIAQDGVRLRASAGAASFRRRKTLELELAKAKALVERLSKDEDDDPGASGKRQQAARDRAARERQAKVEAALAALGEAEKLREKRAKTNKKETQKQKEPRASTTDPQARVMKMADGGFRPAYNVQFASLPESGVIVSVSCETVGSDHGLAEPMAQRIETTYGRRAKTYLVDGGYLATEDICAAARAGTALYCPPPKAKPGQERSQPKHEPHAVTAWRVRMASEEGQRAYQRRARCELVHAKLRNLGLDRLLLRGKEKIETLMRWFSLASNILTEARLRAA